MEFDQYLMDNKIDAAKFAKQLPSLFEGLRGQFDLYGPKNFELQKKFYLNRWRLEYPIEI